MERFLATLKFWFLWIFSSANNFFILGVLRQFYMTSDINSDYYLETVAKYDAWIGYTWAFASILLIYLLNAFYKEQINQRFAFITSLQLFFLGALRLMSAPLALRLDHEFELTASYIIISIIFVGVGVVFYQKTPKIGNETRITMLKRLFLIREKKFW